MAGLRRRLHGRARVGGQQLRLAAVRRARRRAVRGHPHFANDPIALRGIGDLDLHVAPGALGGTIEARVDAPGGALIGSLKIAGTGTAQDWTTVRMPVTDPGGAHALFLVFKNVLVPQNPLLPGSMFRLNFIMFVEGAAVAYDPVRAGPRVAHRG